MMGQVYNRNGKLLCNCLAVWLIKYMLKPGPNLLIRYKRSMAR